MSVVSTVDAHKTKALGVITAALGFIQGYPGLSELLSPDAYAWAMFVIGLLVTVCGFLNSRTSDESPEKYRSDSILSHWGVGLLAALVVVLSLGGCTTSPSKVVEAGCERNESYSAVRCVKTIAEVYEVYQQRIADLVADPRTSEGVKQDLRRIEAHLTPIMVEMLRAALFYNQVQSDLAAGSSEEDKLVIANQRMEAWIAQALPRLYALADALAGR